MELPSKLRALLAAAETPAGAMRLRIGLAVAGFLVWSAIAAVHAQAKAADFDVFWAAGRHAHAPYDPAVIAALKAQLHVKGSWPFVYPPTFLLLAWPFAQLPMTVAFSIWAGLSAAAFYFASSYVARPAMTVAVLFIAPPVVTALAPGQTSLFVGAAAMGEFVLLKRRPALAGVLFAVAACIKPQAMILAPVVLWGHWRAMRWTGITALALVLASFAFGPARWLEWGLAIGDFHHAVAPTTERVNPSALIASPWWTGALALLGLWIAGTQRDLGGLVAGALCMTPYAHQYDLAPLAPLALSWLFGWRETGFGRAAAGTGLLAGMVTTPLAGLGFLVLLALAGTPWRRWQGEKAPPPVLRPSYEA